MIAVPVTEASQVADARRRAVGMGRKLGFDETANGRLAIVATELATNILKYGVSGEILLGAFDDNTGIGIEVISIDRGKGIANLGDALRDGHSTSGSPGTGLGAVKRQAQTFDIASWPGRGALVLARVQAAKQAAKRPFFGVVETPYPGEAVSGDSFGAHQHGRGWTVIVADGLGHGPHAAQASGEAIRLFRRHSGGSPGEIVTAIHAGLRHTRGGAVSVARYDPIAEKITFAGLGNVAGSIAGGGREIRRTVSLVGTAGHVARRIQEFDYAFAPDNLFVMCSDGIGTNWSLDGYPGLLGAHPSLIAAVLYRDYSRGRDDATVLVAGGSSS